MAVMAGLVAMMTMAQGLTTTVKAAPDSFADLAEKVSPAVVNITTSTMVETNTGPGPQVPEGSPFEDFFRQFQNPDAPQQPHRSSALGSGFVISEDGFVVTNNHVIENADEIMIEFTSGQNLPAKVIGTDPKTDIAVLKVEAEKPLPYVPFGNSDTARVGDWVLAVGNPLGQGFSVSAGIVSARNRELSGSYDDYIQTDAAINRGNSGGPLFNMNGEVVGVNTAILSPNGGSIGIGFSMASNVVSKVVSQLQEFGETRRGWLGVRIQDVTPDVAEAMGLESAKGALVTDVPPGPGLDAGIQAGDVITSFDGVNVEDTRGLVRQVGDTADGKSVRVVVVREGKSQTILVTLGRRETAEGTEDTTAPAAQAEPSKAEVLGMSLSELNDTVRTELQLPPASKGLVITEVAEDSEAFDKGLRAGDVISEVGQQPIEVIGDLQARIDEAREGGRKSVLLLIRRMGEPRFVALTVDAE
ncbi:DegQ family serine endoprotease [Donghicola mangrovi]